jgi:16S rRNA G966 N2-methylase RsmD
LLAKQYRVDFIFVPPFKKRSLREENSVAVQGEEDWLNEISKSV